MTRSYPSPVRASIKRTVVDGQNAFRSRDGSLIFVPHNMIESSALLAQFMPRGQSFIALICVCLVTACVLMHYEVLRGISKALARLKQLHRLRVLVLILGLLLTHLVEIWIYALAYGLVDGSGDFGRLNHAATHSQTGWLDYIYFSFVTYTTVGYGDIVPVGPIRFIAASEALNGWLLLGWSASFTFLEMQRFWHDSAK
jgi:hypothetical protein